MRSLLNAALHKFSNAIFLRPVLYPVIGSKWEDKPLYVRPEAVLQMRTGQETIEQCRDYNFLQNYASSNRPQKNGVKKFVEWSVKQRTCRDIF
jgi:hypothetical protein